MNKISVILLISLLVACGAKTKQQGDQLYSRHLKRTVQLTVINTPVPDDKSQLSLLLLNDGQDMDKLRVKEITDSLYRAKAIGPVVVVGIHTTDRMQEYGVVDRPDFQGNGKRARYYDDFVNNELYPFIKKKAGVRKFHSVVIAGCSLGGLSAFDIGWNHADKVDKIGVFSGSFWWRDKDASDSSYNNDQNRIMIAKLKASRKKPKQEYWFYAGAAEELSDRDGDQIPDVIDDTKDVIALVEKRVSSAGAVVYTEAPGAKHDWPYWSAAFPAFMLWAFGGK